MSDLQTFLKKLRIEDVVAQLHEGPDLLAAALVHVEETRLALSEAREDLRLSEANAEAQAWLALNGGAEKMLAAEKKARIGRAVADHPEVRAAREFAASMEREHGLAQADLERVKARMYAARAIEELGAATLLYIASRPGIKK